VNFQTFIGPTLLTKSAFVCAALIVAGDFFCTFFTIFYQNFFYKRLRAGYDRAFSPRCSIVVPCKGVPKNFGKNLEGFLELEYSNFEVIYVAETEEDGATPVIKSILGRHANARLVFAGLSTTCGQKNHNMIAGVKAADNPEILVFADSDIKPAKEWLTELIAPLSDPKNTVTSGFRWLHPEKGTLGEQTHAYENIYIYLTFTTASFFGGVGLWGGSMAIRRAEYENYGVEEKWARSAVDDISLSQLVNKHHGKGIVVPTSITHSDDLLPTIGASTTWLVRQIMFLKSHFKLLWFFAGLPLTLSALSLFLLLPFAVIGSVSNHGSFFALGGGAALLFLIGEFLSTLFYPFLGPMPHFNTFLAYQPVMRFAQVMAFFRTFTTNVITWAGIRYHLNFSGDVWKVER
jgi:cellulose synthase/poly-beta-1,6-N-acetylglucosamine synthase-like glycosyltransferase